jgi:hypothetical protein
MPFMPTYWIPSAPVSVMPLDLITEIPALTEFAVSARRRSNETILFIDDLSSF